MVNDRKLKQKSRYCVYLKVVCVFKPLLPMKLVPEAICFAHLFRAFIRLCIRDYIFPRYLQYHHHHHDAKQSAEASRRCDRSPEQSVLR